MVSGSRPLDMTTDLAESWTVETIERAAALVADLGRCIGSGSSPLCWSALCTGSGANIRGGSMQTLSSDGRSERFEAVISCHRPDIFAVSEGALPVLAKLQECSQHAVAERGPRAE